MIKIYLRNNKGVNLISLTITIIILLIITGAMIYNTKNQISLKEMNDLKNDIEVLSAKVDEYYLKYGEIPELCYYTNKTLFVNAIYDRANANGATLNGEVNPDDGIDYVVIDIEKLGGLTLNYGYDYDEIDGGEYFAIKARTPHQVTLGTQSFPLETAVYVINTMTHQIYFPHGLVVDNIMYYTF